MCVGVDLQGPGLRLVQNTRLESGDFTDLSLWSHDSRFNKLSKTPGAHTSGLCDSSLKLGVETKTSLTEYWGMELEVQGGWHVRTDLLWETREPIPASASWRAQETCHSLKQYGMSCWGRHGYLREVLSWLSSKAAVDSWTLSSMVA